MPVPTGQLQQISGILQIMSHFSLYLPFCTLIVESDSSLEHKNEGCWALIVKFYFE